MTSWLRLHPEFKSIKLLTEKKGDLELDELGQCFVEAYNKN
jgi:hypothetical protein